MLYTGHFERDDVCGYSHDDTKTTDIPAASLLALTGLPAIQDSLFWPPSLYKSASTPYQIVCSNTYCKAFETIHRQCNLNYDMCHQVIYIFRCGHSSWSKTVRCQDPSSKCQEVFSRPQLENHRRLCVVSPRPAPKLAIPLTRKGM